MLIQSVQKKWDTTCTVSSNLTQNAVKMPEISDIIEYAEPRMLMTLIVSGVTAPWQTVVGDTNMPKTQIGKIPDDKLIGDVAYRYRKMGRIERAVVINGQIGTSLADGTFQLSLQDNYIVPGMNVYFYSRTFQARAMALPSGGANAYIYTFKSVDGTVFNYGQHVAPQTGEKTCFGFFTSYGEQSLRGYSRAMYGEEYINHMTIQRGSCAISGSAASDVVWKYFTWNGNQTGGWWFLRQQQLRMQLMVQNERAKLFGRSSMRDVNGALLGQSNLTDMETGNPIIQGDGLIPQIEGGNESYGSGVDGYATWDDFADMMSILTEKGRNVTGNHWYVLTGPSGWTNAQTVAGNKWVNTFGGQSPQQQNSSTGGAEVSVGYNFNTINIGGNSCTFVQHPMFQDRLAFTATGSDGEPIQGGMYLFIDASTVDGRKNIEILTKGAYGINRSSVTAMINGMTGDPETPMTSIDAKEWNYLKEDGIFIYNTESCGIIHRSVV